ncbi:Centromere/kinetochore protein zw10, partial [Globisporangium splendens]
MTTVDVLARKLEETHGEIVQVRAEVIETLRAFYSSASGVSVDEALKIASKWTTTRHHHRRDPLAVGGSSTDAVPRSDLQEKISRLNETLLTTVDQLQANGHDNTAPHAKLVFSFTQRERLARQMQQSTEMLVLTEKLTEIDRILGEIDTHMDAHELVRAAQGVKDAETLLSVLTGGEESKLCGAGAQENIVHIIRLQILKKRNQVKLQLKQIYATTVLWKENSLKVSHRRLESERTLREEGMLAPGAQLRDFWEACKTMGMLSDKLKDLAKALSLHLLKPSLQGADASVKLSRDATGSMLKLVRSDVVKSSTSKKKSEITQTEEKCANIVHILAFVHAEVFLSNAELMNQLSVLLWKIPGNLEAQLMSLLQEKIPQDATALQSYSETLIVAVNAFEENLVAIGFSACANSQLRTFVDQLQELYAKKRRQSILSQGREMMSCGYNDSIKIAGATERCNLEASVVSGKKKGKSGGGGALNGAIATNGEEVESGAFHVPDYRISTCAHDVVELAHQTLIEACTTSEFKCVQLLFQTSRDLLFLFRAVVPTLYERDIANDPRTCMLYHNDCLYIAYHMLTIGHQYKHRLPAPLNRTGTMVDMVPACRDAGEKALITYAKTQADEIAAGAASLPVRDRDICHEGVMIIAIENV